jgi:hypothetical protein
MAACRRTAPMAGLISHWPDDMTADGQRRDRIGGIARPDELFWRPYTEP